MKPSVPEKILQVNGLKTYFYLSGGIAKAVDGVSFHLNAGEVLGVVGESGSGKSVTAQSIMRLIPDPPGRIVDGQIRFDGRNLLDLPPQQMRHIRGNRIAMIFQEPMTSLNPVFTIGNQISEMFILHRKASRREALEASIEMLDRVQIPAPRQRVHEYPHQLSGGMRQRAMIAMALACRPALLIADEPTTALDVTVQAQILDLLTELRERFSMAVLLITHDLGVVARFAERVTVLYAGRVMEEADVASIFRRPGHPYTLGLLKSLPRLERRTRRLEAIPGTVPPPGAMPAGCPFEPRCTFAKAACGRGLPELAEREGGRRVRCILEEGSLS
jgi:oligopeptide/dipeptide ABC transporter ATP-binding protein